MHGYSPMFFWQLFFYMGLTMLFGHPPVAEGKKPAPVLGDE